MSELPDLPQYKCHKIVRAAKIDAVLHTENPDPTGRSDASSHGAKLILDDGSGCNLVHEVNAEWVNKHNPRVGGYFVQYADGYQSYSPAEAFEAGYSRVPDRGEAVLGGSSDQSIEQEIQAKGLTAPRVTPDDIEANIKSEHYFTADDGAFGACRRIDTRYVRGEGLNLLTFCVLVLNNGFTVTGESACASPENFDAEIGRKIARKNAVEKIWPLMGYALKERLFTDA